MLRKNHHDLFEKYKSVELIWKGHFENNLTTLKRVYFVQPFLRREMGHNCMFAVYENNNIEIYLTLLNDNSERVRMFIAECEAKNPWHRICDKI